MAMSAFSAPFKLFFFLFLNGWYKIGFHLKAEFEDDKIRQ